VSRSALLLAAPLFALGCASALPGAAQAPRIWSASVGWQETRLDGGAFGVTGGHGVIARASGRLAQGAAELQFGKPLRIAIDMMPEFSARAWGFDQLEQEPRAFAFELDLGARTWIRPEKWPVGITAQVSGGFSRALFGTSIGPMRFLSARPAFGGGLLYQDGPIGVRVELDSRCYNVALADGYAVIYRGCAVSMAASGLVAW